MRPNKIIAITGGIGSGKSTVSSILEEHGYFVVDCDAITREIYKDKNIAEKVSSIFGGGFICGDELDTKKLGEYVFQDRDRVVKLNDIMHPLIFDKLQSTLDACDSDVVFVQIPLLFETGRQNDFDEIWLVMASEDIRKKRAATRDGTNYSYVAERIKNQLPDEKKAPFAHIIIKNDGTLDDLRNEVEMLVKKL